MSVDPIGGSVGSSQSWNRYSYVLNNPISFIDPDGNQVAPAMTPYGPIPLPLPIPPSPGTSGQSDPVAEAIIENHRSNVSMLEVLLAFAVTSTPGYQWMANENTSDADDEIVIDGMTEDDMYDLQDELSGDDDGQLTSRGDRRSQQRLLDEVADQFGVDRHELGEAIEEHKGATGRGGRDKMESKDIEDIARELANRTNSD